MNKEIDNIYVMELNQESMLDLLNLLRTFNIDVDTLVNKMIIWCYHSKPFWNSLKQK